MRGGVAVTVKVPVVPETVTEIGSPTKFRLLIFPPGTPSSNTDIFVKPEVVCELPIAPVIELAEGVDTITAKVEPETLQSMFVAPTQLTVLTFPIGSPFSKTDIKVAPAIICELPMAPDMLCSDGFGPNMVNVDGLTRAGLRVPDVILDALFLKRIVA